MSCDACQQDMDRFLDGELEASELDRFESHLRACDHCRRAVAQLQALTAPLATSDSPAPPPEVWSAIECRLDESAGRAALRTGRFGKPNGGRWAVAASFAILVGVGVLSLSVSDSPVKASAIDFRILLDALPLDPHEAFRRFLRANGANEASPEEAVAYGRSLDFAAPPTLPGGFTLTATYTLRFGEARGVAASYDRDGEFLAAIFHPPVHAEDYGTHRDLPCAIGQHRGHKVVVGAWKMVHLTTPSTCHCVLSRIDDDAALSAVMLAVSPDAAKSVPHRHGQ